MNKEETQIPDGGKPSKGFFSKSFFKSVISEIQKSIPSTDVQNLPVGQMLTVGIAIQCISLTIFIYFMYSGYVKATNNKFLSLQSDAGDCEDVLKSLTGTYLADSNGNWEGASDFVYTSALYQFQFSNLLVSQRTYASIIQSIDAELADIGVISRQLNLAFNFLIWMSYGLIYQDSVSVQKFYMNGDPLTIFNRDYVVGSVGNRYADCNAASQGSFDSYSGILSLKYEYSEFMANENCSTTLDPIIFGYDEELSGNVFDISVDVRSLSTALALNMYLIDIEDMEEIPGWSSQVHDPDNSSAVVTYFYDPRYPGMAPVACMPWETPGTFLEGGGVVCAVALVNAVALPLINHYGSNRSSPEFCACQDVHVEGITRPMNGLSKECNEFNIMAGLMVFPTSDAEPLLDVISNFGGLNSSIRSYYAMYAAANVGETSKYQTDEEFRSVAYDFCNTSYGGCSIVSINTFDNTDYSVSSYYYQLQNGSCTDSFSASPAAWTKMMSNPPVPVVEPYFECSKTPGVALSESAGIATGFTSSVIPIIVILLLQMLYFWRSKWGKEKYSNKFSDDCHEDAFSDDEEYGDNGVRTEQTKTKQNKDLEYRTYGKKSREDFLGLLSVQLLMMRDRRLPASSPCNPQSESLIHRLMEELKANAATSPSNLITIAHYSNLPKYCHGLRVKKRNVCTQESQLSYSVMHADTESQKNDMEMTPIKPITSKTGATDSEGSLKRLERVTSLQEKKIAKLERNNDELRKELQALRDTVSLIVAKS